MAYWLMKSEPDEFSIDDLRKKGVAGWDGVRNYQARNHLRAMRKGDWALFYHSSVAEPAIVGLMQVVREAYADPSQFDPDSGHYDPASRPEEARWVQVDVKFEKAFAAPLSSESIRRIPGLHNMVLLKNSRLSVQPVAPAEWKILQSHLS